MALSGGALTRATLVTALAGIIVTLLWLANPAGAAATDVEQCFIDSINAERAATGAAPLTWAEDIADYTRDHSAAMAASGGIYHSTSSELNAALPSGWTSWGENVGWHSSPDLPDCTDLFNGFMDSAGHRENLLNPAFQFAATGTYVDAAGELWTTHVFFSHPTYSGSFEGTFADDDGSPFQADIERIYEAGITTGCDPDRFCPGDDVNRGQMAAFLNRALNLPAAGDAGFVDTAGTFYDDINRIAAAGITSGCDATRYCPGDVITREQMAVFLTRALNLPPAPSAGFTDLGGSPFADEINRIAAAGITYGCGGTNFCPDQAVTRGQMAAFLVRALDI